MQSAVDFKIIHETADYIVIDKPPRLLVHPTKPDGAPTLWHELRQLLAFEIANRANISIINRLDRETSGIVLVAKNRETARKFGLSMQARRVQKEYLAIVHGWPEWEKESVNAPIIRRGEVTRSEIYLQQTIHSGGAEAVTDLEIVRRFSKLTTNGQNFTLIRASPRTGRTHQIRVHFAAIGHPIVGDKIYGARQHYLRFIETGWTDEVARDLLLERHALHASRLRFDDEHDWQSTLPDDLAQFLEEPSDLDCSRAVR